MNNKGSILIYVLMTISFVVAIALLINEDATRHYELTNKVYTHNQAYIYANTAMNIIKGLLVEDDDAFDSMNDEWYNIPDLLVDRGTVSIKVNPLNARVNINVLTKNDEEFTSRIYNMLKTILLEYNITSITPGMFIDWIDEDIEPFEEGREDYLYINNGRKYSTKNNNLDTLLELIYLDDYDTYKNLKYHFTVDGDKKINVNFCNELTLISYVPEVEDYTDDIIDYRKNKEYKDISLIREATLINDDDYIKAIDFITVASSFFYAAITVTLGGEQFVFHSLINREGDDIKVIKFLEGYNEAYF